MNAVRLRTTTTRPFGPRLVTALPVKAKSTPLVNRTPFRFSVVLEEMLTSSMYSNSWGLFVLPARGEGLYMISLTRRNPTLGCRPPRSRSAGCRRSASAAPSRRSVSSSASNDVVSRSQSRRARATSF